MSNLDERGNALIREVWTDLQKRSREWELEQIKANPEKHALTRLMAEGKSTSYSFHPGSDRRVSAKRREITRFCVSKHRNAAGFFLQWRQVDRYKQVRGRWKWFKAERFDFKADKVKKELHRVAGVKAERDRLEWRDKCAARLPDAPEEAKMMLDEAIRSLG